MDWRALWPSVLTRGRQAADLCLAEPGEPWLNLQSWGGTMTLGVRGTEGPHHDGMSLPFGFLGAQDAAVAITLLYLLTVTKSWI